LLTARKPRGLAASGIVLGHGGRAISRRRDTDPRRVFPVPEHAPHSVGWDELIGSLHSSGAPFD
jgi:hypothetical protein